MRKRTLSIRQLAESTRGQSAGPKDVGTLFFPTYPQLHVHRYPQHTTESQLILHISPRKVYPENFTQSFPSGAAKKTQSRRPHVEPAAKWHCRHFSAPMTGGRTEAGNGFHRFPPCCCAIAVPRILPKKKQSLLNILIEFNSWETPEAPPPTSPLPA